MSTQIISAVIGPLTKHPEWNDWWESEGMAVPLLDNKKLPVTFMDYLPEDDASFIQDADAALRGFLALGPDFVETMKKPIWENYKDFKYAVGPNDLDRKIRNLKEDQVWQYVRPGSVELKRGPEDIMYLTVYCGCSWEREHGLQLVFRQGNILSRVSEIDGHLTDV